MYMRRNDVSEIKGDNNMRKHLFLIHGRNFKPAQQALEPFWFEAISHGLARDGYNDALDVYNNDVIKTFSTMAILPISFLAPMEPHTIR